MSNHSDSKQVTVNGQVSETGATSPALRIRRRLEGQKASDTLLSPMALMALGLAGAASVNAQTVSSDDSAENADRLQAMVPGLEEQVVIATDEVAAADAPVSAELQEPAVLANDGAEAAMLALADSDILPIDFAAQVNQLAVTVAAEAYAPVLMAQASVAPYAAAEPAASAAAAAPAVAAESGISWTMIAAGAAGLVGVAVASSSSSKDTTPPVAPGLALATDTGSSSSDGITKTGTVNVTGLEVGATWAYSKDSGSTWTPGTGTTFTLTDGTYAASAIQVRQTDTAGNVSLTTGKNAAAITIDNVIAATTVALLNDTGSLATDKLTNSALLSLNTAASDVTRTYSVDSGTASGTYTAPTTDGSHTVVVTDTDTAGNTSTASLTFTLDKTIAKPTAALTNDTGSSLTDMITSSALLTLSAKAGDVTRTYSVDSGTASGTYTAPTVNGSHTVVVTDTDTAGNTTSSTTLTFTLDTAAPTAAVTRTGTDALAQNASGSLTITFDATVTGFTVADLVDAKGGTFANLVTSDAGTTWTVDFTPNPDKLGPASITVLNASYADIAGNSGSASAALAVSYFANTTATDGYISGGNVYLDIDKSGTVTTGDTLVGTTLANGSVSVALSSGQDAYDLLVTGGTDVSTGLAFAGLLRAPAGSTVISPLTTLVQAVMSADTSSLSTAAKLAAAQATVVSALSLPTGVDLTSYDPVEVALGSSSTAAQKAIAVAIQSQSIVVANLLVAGSAALQGASTTAGSVTAAEAGAAIIGALVTQISTGTAVNLNSSSTLSTLLTKAATDTTIASDLNAATKATLITAASTSLSVSNQAVSDAMSLAASNVSTGAASNQFLASLTDAVQVQTVAQGSVSTQLAAGTAVTLTATTLAVAADAVTTAQLTTTQAGVADTTAPVALAAKLHLDSGSSASDGITKTGTIDVTGFETGATWQYSTDAGATWTTGSGTSFTLAAGTYAANAVAVRQTDAAGNVSDLGKITTAITVDQTIATPTVALASDTGTDGDKITSSALLTLSTAASDVTRTYAVDSGTASSTYTAPTADGSHTVIVTDTDTAGNTASSTTLTFTLDKTIATTTVALANDNGISATDKITNSALLSLNTAAGDVTRTYAVDGGNASSAYTAPTADGSHTVVVTDTDTAGNSSNATLTFTLDKTVAAPTLVAVDTGTLATDGITNSGVVNVAGIESGASWQYSSNAGTSWTTGTGTAFTLAAGTYAANAVQVRETDVAGNTSTASAVASALVVDQTVPASTLVAATTVNSTGGELYGFNFSEAVTGFDLTDITVVNGLASAFTTVDSSHYTAIITPNSSTAPLSMTVNVGAGAATDTAGNTSTAAAQILHSVLWGTSGNDSLTVGTAADTVYLGSAGTDTVVMAAATGSTAAALDKVYGFGSGDILDLKTILGTGGSGYTSTAVADTGVGFVELKNLVLTQGTSTTTVKFDVSFDLATISSSKITGAVIDLVYDYSKVSAAQVTSPTFVDPTFGSNVNVWANVVSNLATTATVTANGKIALTADLSTSVNPIIDTAGKAFGVTLIVNSLVTTFSIGLESVASGGSTSIVTANNVTSNVDVGITKTAGASLGSTGVLQIVADTSGALTTVTDNQFHMATSYDSVNKVTHLLVQYDTNSTFGTTALSSVIAMDFDGDVTTTLVPASLTYTFP